MPIDRIDNVINFFTDCILVSIYLAKNFVKQFHLSFFGQTRDFCLDFLLYGVP